jgi:hypothetical protein
MALLMMDGTVLEGRVVVEGSMPEEGTTLRIYANVPEDADDEVDDEDEDDEPGAERNRRRSLGLKSFMTELGLKVPDDDVECDSPPVRSYQLYRWVNDNNPPEDAKFGKGWWDYIETLYRLAALLDAHEASVIATYAVDTPPPQERIMMPAVVLEKPGIAIALRFDFGRNPTRDMREWIVSVERRSPYLGPTFGLFDLDEDLRALPVTGLAQEGWLFGSYRANPARFTCALENEWDLWALLRIVTHEV